MPTICKNSYRKLDTYFNESEFYKPQAGQPDCWELPPVLLAALVKIRNYYNLPIRITSTYRGEQYNKKVEGAANSYHLSGRAVDFQFMSNNNDTIEMLAYEVQNDIGLGSELVAMGIKGWGFYDSFIHIDNRPVFTVFKPRESQGGSYGDPYGIGGDSGDYSYSNEKKETQSSNPFLSSTQNFWASLTKRDQLIAKIGGGLLLFLIIIILFKRKQTGYWPGMY